MTDAATLVDLAIVALLVTLVWRALATTDTFEAIVLYIVVGTLMALCWARLGAPDLALVEAIVGAGVTGALLLHTLGHVEEDRS